MRSRILIATVLAALAAVASQTPVAMRLENDTGLQWLYALRGPLPAPPGAAVVALDHDSVAWLQRNAHDIDAASPALAACLSGPGRAALARLRNPTDLPREVLACLVEALAGAGAALTVFDVHFAQARADDPRFASALAAAGNVLLLERVLERGDVAAAGGPLSLRIAPVPGLREAALGTVGFHVEGGAGRRTTRYRARFESFPDLPAMPVEALRRLGHPVPDLAPRPLFWLYGAPWTVPTAPLRAFFDPAAPPPSGLAGAAVFVGASSPEPTIPLDGFPVPAFSGGASGLSGVELAATAFLNIRHDQRLAEPGRAGRAALAAAVAFLAGLAGLAGRSWRTLALVPAAGLATAALAAAAFAQGLWLPVTVPLLLAIPLAALCGLGARLNATRRVTLSLAPRRLSERLLEGRVPAPEPQMATALYIDIADSTQLSQSLSPEGFADLLSHFYRLVSGVVDRNDGAVFDYIGDAVLALFAEEDAGPDHAAKACAAALGIERACHDAMTEGRLAPVSCRIGISSGPIALGLLAFGSHISPSALGDPVYRAERLQELGKKVMPGLPRPAIVTLIDETVSSRLPPWAPPRTDLGEQVLRGRSAPSRIWRLAPAQAQERRPRRAG